MVRHRPFQLSLVLQLVHDAVPDGRVAPELLHELADIVQLDSPGPVLIEPGLQIRICSKLKFEVI